MDVDAALYPRKAIERLGIAPLTSMFQYGENDRRMANDWRPEIHDSDGLAMWTGSGEWIWRPLANPRSMRFNAFADENPRGFGLLQRDRNFDHYQDDGVFYERRPSLWVEPKSGWGKGSVQLVEIPTVDETFDNIVAFWNPAAKPRAGEELLFSYRLHWGARPPVQASAARVVATRTGIGGVVGQQAQVLLVALRGRLRRRRPLARWRRDEGGAGDHAVARQGGDHVGAAAGIDQRLSRDVRPEAAR